MNKIDKLDFIFPKENDVPEPYRLTEYMEQRQFLINGKLRRWEQEVIEVNSPLFLESPAGEKKQVKLGCYPKLDAPTGLEALDAAVQAYGNGTGVWPTMTVSERITCVENFLAKLRQSRDEIVKLLMWEIGKNLADSQKEVDRTCDYISDTIAELKELDRRSSRFNSDQSIVAQIRRAPLGVALCMGPYNYPLNETFTTLIPALIMGNTVVFKPAKFGVLLMTPLLTAFRDCFPPGVVNIIFGRGRELVGPIMETGKVDVLAFIGTHKGATDLKKLHPKPHRLRAVLGLDAKNPAIVLPDVDIENAVEQCLLGSLSFNGQRCTALKIIFVHELMAEQFVNKMDEKVSTLKAGMPWEPGVMLTPLPEPGKPQYLSDLVSDAIKKGADVINFNGGKIEETFFWPAILFPVSKNMKIYQEEQFGPIIPIVPYSDIEELKDYIINSNYGQQVSIFGNDSEDVASLIDVSAFHVGRINLNSQCQRGPDTFPFNGRKDSAEGTLSVFDALRTFSIRSMVACKDNQSNKDLVATIVKDRASKFLSTDYIF